MEVSNLRPSVCKTDALTAELIARMARLAGLEPATLASAGLRSIQLSYKRTNLFKIRNRNFVRLSSRRSLNPKQYLIPEFQMFEAFRNLNFEFAFD